MAIALTGLMLQSGSIVLEWLLLCSIGVAFEQAIVQV
jgi:hypothetical protein